MSRFLESKSMLSPLVKEMTTWKLLTETRNEMEYMADIQMNKSIVKKICSNENDRDRKRANQNIKSALSSVLPIGSVHPENWLLSMWILSFDFLRLHGSAMMAPWENSSDCHSHHYEDTWQIWCNTHHTDEKVGLLPGHSTQEKEQNVYD